MEIISCGVFKLELEYLSRAGFLSLPRSYIPSRFHLYPSRLEKMLTRLIRQKTGAGKRVVLLFGDCHARMCEQEHSGLVSRVEGINCPDILLPRETYRQLRRQGAFFLLPDWAVHWQDIFQKELGLRGDTAKMFMQEMHSRLVYIDTGVMDPPRSHLGEMSKFSGLPFKILPVSLQILREKIIYAQQKFNGDLHHEG